MHELSVAQSLVKIAAEHAVRNGSSRVLSVELLLGSLAGVQADSLEFCFPMAARDTPCEGALLHITFITAVGRCAGCGTSSEVTHLMDRCPQCDGWPLEVKGGSELMLKSVEVT
jgi:hydrogenase nickel incorporation protein HypA/HybF